jgi:riboflavin biosynthesis protein RibD
VNEHLARALELAERGRGTTHPNPVVGAVVVAAGEIIGEAWHERKGEPHAEVLALRAAGERARGATLYLTMEPCAHHGSTPPCTEAVLAAGVARVVAPSLDPHPQAGGGLERLREAGVEVDHADLFEARAQNEAWRTWVAQSRPFVTYKAAMTLDGRLTVPGERWINIMLHESGHAAYDVAIDRALPYLLHRAAHTFVTEAIAILAQRELLQQPQAKRKMLRRFHQRRALGID